MKSRPVDAALLAHAPRVNDASVICVTRLIPADYDKVSKTVYCHLDGVCGEGTEPVMLMCSLLTIEDLASMRSWQRSKTLHYTFGFDVPQLQQRAFLENVHDLL